jgi:N-methylhydantoinase B
MPAKSGNVTVKKAKGGEEAMRKAKGYALEAGDCVILETGGGGGYGEPKSRDPAAVRRDVERGYVSREAATRDYGVKIEGGDGG